LSCRHTTLYTPVAWSYVAHLPLPITSAGDRSSDTPTATLPTLPTHRPSIRHAVSYRYDNRSGLETRCRAVEMSTHTCKWCAVAYVVRSPFFELERARWRVHRRSVGEVRNIDCRGAESRTPMHSRAGRVQLGWKEPRAASQTKRGPQWWSLEKASQTLSASTRT
jgi:hypothetical protein